jgi:hypothetical protein
MHDLSFAPPTCTSPAEDAPPSKRGGDPPPLRCDLRLDLGQLVLELLAGVFSSVTVLKSHRLLLQKVVNARDNLEKGGAGVRATQLVFFFTVADGVWHVYASLGSPLYAPPLRWRLLSGIFIFSSLMGHDENTLVGFPPSPHTCAWRSLITELGSLPRDTPGEPQFTPPMPRARSSCSCKHMRHTHTYIRYILCT